MKGPYIRQVARGYRILEPATPLYSIQWPGIYESEESAQEEINKVMKYRHELYSEDKGEDI